MNSTHHWQRRSAQVMTYSRRAVLGALTSKTGRQKNALGRKKTRVLTKPAALSLSSLCSLWAWGGKAPQIVVLCLHCCLPFTRPRG